MAGLACLRGCARSTACFKAGRSSSKIPAMRSCCGHSTQVVARAQALSRKLVEGKTGSSVGDFLSDRAREAEAE
jgi:hypothetical protein